MVSIMSQTAGKI